MKKTKYSKNNINNQAEEKPKQNILKNKALWGLIIIVLMFGSVISFGFFNKNNNATNTNKVEYNGYTFTNNGKGWITDYKGQQVAFGYTPNEVTDINLEKLTFGNKFEYIIFKPGEFDENNYEVNRLRSLLALNGIKVYPACIEEKNCGNLPVNACNENAIYLKLGNETKGYWDTCYILESKSEDMLKLIDRFIYNVYGIA